MTIWTIQPDADANAYRKSVGLSPCYWSIACDGAHDAPGAGVSMPSKSLAEEHARRMAEKSGGVYGGEVAS